jgi:bifunctional non-homologous end joining protein LigD
VPAAALATLVTEPPAGDEWVHEVKLDGYRILARLDHGRARLVSRNGKDWTDEFPAVAAAVEGLDVRSALLDGEVAMVLPDGTTSFSAMQNRGSQKEAALTYFVFDLLHLDGRDLTPLPLRERKEALRGVLPRGRKGLLRYGDHVVGQGAAFFAEACRMGLEGIVSKRADAPYRPGRSRDWLKVKCTREQEFVVGGFTEPEGSRAGIGALVLGVHEEGALRCVGKVGTGFTDKMARDLRRRLEALEQPGCPFTPTPKGMGRPRWVRPELVAEVDFTEWTPEGRLRHPSFKGLREDKAAGEIVREVAKAPPGARTPAPGRAPRGKGAARRGAEAEVAGVRLTHADRVLYPEQGLTKLGLARFYEEIADWILPHLADRPTTLVRCPEGLSEPCFYQKHVDYAPDVVRRVRIKEKTKSGEYVVVDTLPALIGLVQIGILEIHTWNATVARLETPDRLVFDLDPAPDVPFARVMDAARRVRAALRADGREGFVKTTGGKGLHVVTPLVPGASWAECAAYAEALAVRLAGEAPEAFVATMSKARRKGRIYIDWLRNVRGATSIASFSTRARAGAPVSVPLRWDELTADLRPDAFTVESVPRRLRARRADPWAGYEEARRPLRAAPAGRDRPPRPRTRRKAAGRK